MITLPKRCKKKGASLAFSSFALRLPAPPPRFDDVCVPYVCVYVPCITSLTSWLLLLLFSHNGCGFFYVTPFSLVGQEQECSIHFRSDLRLFFAVIMYELLCVCVGWRKAFVCWPCSFFFVFIWGAPFPCFGWFVLREKRG